MRIEGKRSESRLSLTFRRFPVCLLMKHLSTEARKKKPVKNNFLN